MVLTFRKQWRRALPFFLLLGSFSVTAWAQDLDQPKPKPTDQEILAQAERDLELIVSGKTMKPADSAIRIHHSLTGILKRDPSSPLRSRIESTLIPAQEILGKHYLTIATFYLSRQHGLKGAESRLREIVAEFPHFSQMDEVLFQLSTVSLRDDRIDDARGYLRKLICGYPSSDQARLAFERLEKIGFGAWQGCEKVKPLTQGQLTGAQPSRLHGLKGGSEDAWAPVSDRGLGNTFG